MDSGDKGTAEQNNVDRSRESLEVDDIPSSLLAFLPLNLLSCFVCLVFHSLALCSVV